LSVTAHPSGEYILGGPVHLGDNPQIAYGRGRLPYIMSNGAPISTPAVRIPNHQVWEVDSIKMANEIS
jgi:hypothetical protein